MPVIHPTANVKNPLRGQLRECKEYAEKNGMTVLNTYIDRALSAKTDNRPEFQQMIKDSAHYKAILRKNGVKVLSATEAIATDSTGILLESLLEGYAEFYSAELAEKVVRGMTENALKCKFNGGGIPMRYVIDKDQYFQIDPLSAPLIIEIFKLYSQGTSMQKLVDMLNEKGVKSSRGGKITLNIINNILKNRRYIGESVYRDVVKPDWNTCDCSKGAV